MKYTKFQKLKFVLLFMGISIFTSGTANSMWQQPNMYSSGVYMGNQPCPYPTAYGEGAISVNHFTQKLYKNLAKKERELEKAEIKLEGALGDIDEIENDTEDGSLIGMFKTKNSKTFILEYLRNPEHPVFDKKNHCFAASTFDAIADRDGEVKIEDEVKRAKEKNPDCVMPSKQINCKECFEQINSEEQTIYGMCSDPRLVKKVSKWRSNSCQRKMDKYSEAINSEEKSRADVDRLTSQTEDLRERIGDREEEEAEKKNNPYATEAGYCPDGSCGKGNLEKYGVPLMAGILGYKAATDSVKYTSDTNAELGKGTNPINAGLFSASIALGAYGAMQPGVGRGAHGCSTNGPGFANNNISAFGSILGAAALAGGPHYPGSNTGAFGYPQNYYQTPSGAGMINQGFLPNGQWTGYNNINNGSIPPLGPNGQPMYGPSSQGNFNAQGQYGSNGQWIGNNNGFGPSMGPIIGPNGQPIYYGPGSQGNYNAQGQYDLNGQWIGNNNGFGPSMGPNFQGNYNAQGQYGPNGQWGNNNGFGPPWGSNGPINSSSCMCIAPPCNCGNYNQGPLGPYNQGQQGQNSIYYQQQAQLQLQYQQQQMQLQQQIWAQAQAQEAQRNELKLKMDELWIQYQQIGTSYGASSAYTYSGQVNTSTTGQGPLPPLSPQQQQQQQNIPAPLPIRGN